MVQTHVEHAEAPEKVTQSWQPIETAPRDGTDIMAFGPDGPRVAYWEEGHSIFGGFWMLPSTGDHRLGQMVRNDHFSHWMPLPPAPDSDDRSESSTSE